MAKEIDEMIKRSKSIIMTEDLILTNKDNINNISVEKRNVSKNKLNSKEKIRKYTNNMKNNNILQKIIQLKFYFIAIELLIIMNLFIQILSCTKIFRIKLKYSNITIKVNGKGEKFILSTQTGYFKREYFPNEIYINNIKKDQVQNKYDLTEDDNIIKLVWYNKLSNINCIFCGCSDIYDINFSDFDTSDLIDISWMFWSASYTFLTSLDLI